MSVDRKQAASKEQRDGIPPADSLDAVRGMESFENRTESSFAERSLAEPLALDVHTQAFNSFLNGNDEAFRSLYDVYERQLYLFVVRIMGSKSDAEDVFQEVWTRMFRLRGEMKKVRKFSGLLFTVARNLSINAIRNRKTLSSISLDDASSEVELVARSHEVEESDLREVIERALMRLPIEQREAFVLREYFGYSYEEIGSMTGATMVTAKTRAWRGRERLRKMISAWLDLKQ